MNDPLKALSRAGPTAPEDSPQPTTRKKTLLYKGLPWVVALAALFLLLTVYGDRVLPAKTVRVESVVTQRAMENGAAPADQSGNNQGVDPYEAEALFQASGWFEADPYIHRVPALADGVIAEVHVLEGQNVETGDRIATMITEDARLALDRAGAALASAEAELAAARTKAERARAAVETMERELAVARALREEAADLFDRFKDVSAGTVAERDVVQARLRLETEEERVALLQARLRERELEVREQENGIRLREANVASARASVAKAKLQFERMTIRAPMSGIVQRLFVSPGQKRMMASENPDSSTVAWLFDPSSLQARIDVPLAEAGQLFVGQAVRLESEFLPGEEMKGHVQRIVGEADLQRNTLQVKVALADPPASLRPEILCRAHFLTTSAKGRTTGAVREPNAPRSGASSEKALAERSGDASARVWVVDATGRRAEQRQLRLGRETADGYMAVREGLRPGDRVILNPPASLKNGTRIQYD
ncbi:MAG: efflux RND transporter periplasmic adaptor subunit [Verrucomicrobia bacterium]|jgi:RND family efflux transporter MFP subunit|nr:efflux RND transporter periplasmic adaptor subunit [Verrucomicrobiota bacterium]